MPDTKPYWYPVLTDAAWCESKRKDYPEHAHLSDDELRDTLANGQKYQTLWDHVGEAYADFELLADAYLAWEKLAGTYFNLVDEHRQVAKTKALECKNGDTMVSLEQLSSDCSARITQCEIELKAAEEVLKPLREILKSAKSEMVNLACRMKIWQDEHGQKLKEATDRLQDKKTK